MFLFIFRQQLPRKRYIGNDIVTLVFQVISIFIYFKSIFEIMNTIIENLNNKITLVNSQHADTNLIGYFVQKS